MKKYKWHYFFGIFLAAIVCVFRMDTSTDNILETALTAVLHNGDFSYSPFTGELMVTTSYWSPMTLFYSILARIFDVHPVLIGKILMPVLVMILFITVWRMLFEQLFGKNIQTQIALWILLVSSVMFCFSKPYDFTGLWVSPWTDRSIFVYIILPLMGTGLLGIFKRLYSKQKQTINSKFGGADSQDRYFKLGKRGFIIFAFFWTVSIAVATGLNGCIFLNSTYAFPDNRFKMDKEIMDIREMLEGVPEVKMLAPFEVATQIQDCDDKVKLVCNPDELSDVSSITDMLEKYNNANIVVLPKSCANENEMYTLDYLKFGNTEKYEVYEYVPNLGEYTVTQYASSTGGQSLIYTISDWNNHFIIIDGGWKEDTDWLLKLIKDNGGKVDVWILTHPHPDHIGAFNGVYASGVVKIDTIYAVPVDYETYKSRAKWWDMFEIYDEFVTLTEEADNIVYLNEGDVIDLFGLKMEVFHSFDLKDLAEDGDPCNNGGMIFKLSAQQDSMLFLADVGGNHSEEILEKWGDKLKSDYVQMGHHGNGGMSETVYRVVNPKAAFFDAPESLMQNEDLNAPQKRALMESLGSEIYYYATAPNQIVME